MEKRRVVTLHRQRAPGLITNVPIEFQWAPLRENIPHNSSPLTAQIHFTAQVHFLPITDDLSCDVHGLVRRNINLEWSLPPTTEGIDSRLLCSAKPAEKHPCLWNDVKHNSPGWIDQCYFIAGEVSRMAAESPVTILYEHLFNETLKSLNPDWFHVASLKGSFHEATGPSLHL